MDERIVPLRSLFARPEPALPSAAPEAVIDPRVEIEAERARIFKLSRDEGYAAGMKQAAEEIERRSLQAEKAVAAAHAVEGARLRDANEQLAHLLIAVPDAVAGLDERIEPLAVEAAFMATLRVLGEGAARRPLIVDVCRQALLEYRQRPVTLRVCAQDSDAVSALSDEASVKVLSDEHLAPGQCRLETHKGLYDTSLEVRLNSLLQGFLAAVRPGGRVA
ncbi:MAG: FliH/SctL family protein [Pseudomonadota bacterium]|nr:FliH/SctL family protein [Pseudomonadota bacterium]